MILVDLNQIMISNIMMFLNSHYIGTLEEKAAFTKDSEVGEEVKFDIVRHMVLNSLRMYKKKFGQEYGDLVLCCDGRRYWRKDKFEYYKASRKATRSSSGYDWEIIFNVINQITEEIRTTFPYKMIYVETAEADDVIASIVFWEREGKESPNIFEQDEPIMIISADKDFIQLQKWDDVAQYSPIQKKPVVHKDPRKYLHELIMRGDRSDGIPNFLSKDDTFVTGGRQKPISKNKLSTWLGQKPEQFCNENTLRNYKRNQILIDFAFIPEEIEYEICQEYFKDPVGNKSRILQYLIDNRLKELTNNIGDF